MEKEQGGSGGMVVRGRVTIDTRAPFRSVKEAVALFGERVLVGEIYAKQLKEMQVTKKATDKENDVTSKLEIVSTELEETKQNLQKTREEGNHMANCLKSLKQELEETKRELQNLKATKSVAKDHPKVAINPEIEELKFVEINPNVGNNDREIDDNDHYQQELQKKKFVTFASPPSLTREIKESRNTNDERGKSNLGRSSSFRKEEKKKATVSFMGWLLSKKKRGNEGDHDGRSPTK